MSNPYAPKRGLLSRFVMAATMITGLSVTAVGTALLGAPNETISVARKVGQGINYIRKLPVQVASRLNR